VTTQELNNGEFWRWGFFDLSDDVGVQVVEGSDLGAGFVTTRLVAGDVHAIESDTDFDGSRVIPLRRDGTLGAGPTTPHSLRNVFQVR